MADKMLSKLLSVSNNKKQNKQRMDIVDIEYKNKLFTQKQTEFISNCWRFLSVYPIKNEETVYANIIIPSQSLIFSGKTTHSFVPVSAKEFKEMFYITCQSMASSQQKKKE